MVSNPNACIVIRPPATAACGGDAHFRVLWPDGDVSPTCEECALYLSQVAQGHGTMLKIERGEKTP